MTLFFYPSRLVGPLALQSNLLDYGGGDPGSNPGNGWQTKLKPL